MGAGSSGGGGGGGRDEQKRFDPSRPVTRPDPAEVARALEAKRDEGRSREPPPSVGPAAPSFETGRRLSFGPGYSSVQARTGGTRLSFDTALDRGTRSSVQVPGVDVAATPPRLEAGYSTPSVQPNRVFDTTAAMSRRGLEGARRNVETMRTGDFPEAALALPALGFNIADAAVGGAAGLAADLLPGDSRATERSVARGLMSLPEAFMGISPGRVTNVLDDALERAAGAARIRDLGQRVAADEFQARYPSDRLGIFEGAYFPGEMQYSSFENVLTPGVLSPGEARYLTNLNEANYYQERGLGPEEIFERTGIVNIPRRDVTGAEIGGAFPFSTSGIGFFAPTYGRELNRVMAGETARLRDVIGMPENLREGLIVPTVTRTPVSGERLRNIFGLPQRRVAGYYDDQDARIVLNTRVPRGADMTMRHEAAHLYLDESGLPRSAIGSSPDREAVRVRQNLANIRDEVISAENAYRMGQIDDFQLQEAYDAAAAQRAAYSRSPVELYSENLGEVLARRAEGDTNQYVTATLREAFNPYIPTSSGINQGRGAVSNVVGAVEAPLRQGLFSLGRLANYPISRYSIGTPGGIVARVPSNVFTRTTTGERVPVFRAPSAPPPSWQDPWANVGN